MTTEGEIGGWWSQAKRSIEAGRGKKPSLKASGGTAAHFNVSVNRFYTPGL